MIDRSFQNAIAAMCIAMVAIVAGSWTLEAAKAGVDAWLDAERVELCHRRGGTPDICGTLPR